jgi:hypothetical protein
MSLLLAENVGPHGELLTVEGPHCGSHSGTSYARFIRLGDVVFYNWIDAYFL